MFLLFNHTQLPQSSISVTMDEPVGGDEWGGAKQKGVEGDGRWKDWNWSAGAGRPAGEVSESPPSTALSDLLVVWNWPRWEVLHQKLANATNQNLLPSILWPPIPQIQLLNIQQPTTWQSSSD